jgi:hypothetical protein
VCCRLVPPGPPDSVLVHRPACGGVAEGEDSCVCGTLPQQGGFLPEHRRRYPVAIPLYPSPPSGWVWDLLNFQIKGKLSAPLRIRAVPGTQLISGADGM